MGIYNLKPIHKLCQGTYCYYLHTRILSEIMLDFESKLNLKL